ncbi:MAG: histidinol-phosphate transaminase [Xanthomonadales bacterium]|nr:histidinol-phosphate transaminase [Xanthomonadales bacterium]
MRSQISISKLARPEIVAMKPYSSARSEAPGEGVLLNANESPWSLLPDSKLNRYPEPQPQRLVSRLANLYQVNRKQLLVTRGSDEGIDLLTRVFCRAGEDAILQCTPAFGMYAIAAQTQGVDVVSIPRLAADNFSMDVDKLLLTLANDTRLKLIFLTTPNNPTGDSIDKATLLKILQSVNGRALVVVDEAYAEFSNKASFCPLVTEYNNLVILRTLSKAWAGAGLRCGTVIAQTEVIDLLGRIIAPYPLASPVVELAERLLDPEVLSLQQQQLQALANNKQRLFTILKAQNYITDIWPGDANFILIRLDDASGLMRYCGQQNIILRAFNNEPLLQNCIRISVGSNSDLDSLETVLKTWKTT